MKLNYILQKKNKVHSITPLVDDIIRLKKYGVNPATISKTLGCHYSHVRLVLGMHKSTAHVFLPRESVTQLNHAHR